MRCLDSPVFYFAAPNIALVLLLLFAIIVGSVLISSRRILNGIISMIVIEPTASQRDRYDRSTCNGQLQQMYACACQSGWLACLALIGRGTHIACVPRLRQRQSFSRTLLSQKPEWV
jgi:hypothetical protein